MSPQKLSTHSVECSLCSAWVLKSCQLIRWRAASEDMPQMTRTGHQSGQTPLSGQNPSYSGSRAISKKSEEAPRSPPKAWYCRTPQARLSLPNAFSTHVPRWGQRHQTEQGCPSKGTLAHFQINSKPGNLAPGEHWPLSFSIGRQVN